MKFRGLIIAVVVLLALGGALYWSNHHKPAEPSAAPAASASPSPVILKLDQSSVDRVSLARKGSAPVMLLKGTAGDWKITEPKAWNADQDAVTGVLSSLSSLTADRVVEEKAVDLKSYGLDNPSLTVDIGQSNHNERKLLLGDDTPAGNDVYATVAGDARVFTLASYNKTSIDKGLNDLRDKRLVTMTPGNVSKVELEKGAQTAEFARIKDGWQMLKPKPARADGSAVDELLRSVADARMDLAASGSDDAAKQYAQAAPFAAVTLTGDQGSQKLDVRKNNDDYFVKSSVVDGSYKVDAGLGTALSKNADDFRTRKLFDFGFEDPNNIELHAGSKAWFFTHGGNDWWSNGKKMDGSAVEALVDKLRDLAATGFPDAGFTNPDLVATVTSADGKRVEKVEIANAGNKSIARRANETGLYELGSAAISGLVSAADAVKPAK